MYTQVNCIQKGPRYTKGCPDTRKGVQIHECRVVYTQVRRCPQCKHKSIVHKKGPDTRKVVQLHEKVSRYTNAGLCIHKLGQCTQKSIVHKKGPDTRKVVQLHEKVSRYTNAGLCIHKLGGVHNVHKSQLYTKKGPRYTKSCPVTRNGVQMHI